MDGLNLAQVHAELRAALEPLGIDVGPETLRVWEDREAHGTAPLPGHALRRLSTLVNQLQSRRP